MKNPIIKEGFMDIFSGSLFVGVVYLVFMTILARIFGLPVPLSMGLSLMCAIIVVLGNRQRINKWMLPSPRDKKSRDLRPRGGNRADRRSKR